MWFLPRNEAARGVPGPPVLDMGKFRHAMAACSLAGPPSEHIWPLPSISTASLYLGQRLELQIGPLRALDLDLEEFIVFFAPPLSQCTPPVALRPEPGLRPRARIGPRLVPIANRGCPVLLTRPQPIPDMCGYGRPIGNFRPINFN